MKASRRFGIFLLVVVVAALLDQLVKALMVEILSASGQISVIPSFSLRLAYNPGISFSLFSETFREAPWLLAAIKIGIVIGIGILAIRSPTPSEVISYGFIAGGAVGNIADRFRIGAVVDYIDLYYRDWHWPTFNLADCFIFLGIALLVGNSLFAPRGRNAPP